MKIRVITYLVELNNLLLSQLVDNLDLRLDPVKVVDLFIDFFPEFTRIGKQFLRCLQDSCDQCLFLLVENLVSSVQQGISANLSSLSIKQGFEEVYTQRLIEKNIVIIKTGRSSLG